MNTQTQIGFSSLTINSCFQNHYIVPDYQREYVWGQEEVEQLLSDLMEGFQTNAKKDYFLGTIVTYKTDGYFELIDGQQRLTTFFILLCTLRRIYAQNNESTQVVDNLIFSPIMNENGDTVPSYHLKLQYEDASNYLELIYQNMPEPKEKSASGEKLFEAFNTIVSFFAHYLSDFGDLKKFAFFLLNKTRFIQIETYDITDALKIFETINQRGIGLNPMDLLKNMIFRQVDRVQFKELNMKWKEITSALENIKEKPLRFLRYFIMANYDVSNMKDGILREDQIYSWLTSNNDQCHYVEKPFEFVSLMKKNVDKYIAYLKPLDNDNGNLHLKCIPLLAGRSYKLHLLLLLSAFNMDKATLSKFKKVIESAVYYSVINKIPTNQTERTFIGWCVGLRNVKTEDDMKKFVREAMMPTISLWKKTNMQNFMQLGLGSMQQYRVKFIMAKLSAYVDALLIGQNEPGDLSSYMATGVDIEHIMPVKCSDIFVYEIAEDEFDMYLNRLGNLTLLENSINKSIHNSTYETKRMTYPQSRFHLTKSIPSLTGVGTNTAITRTNQKLKSWSVWTGHSIEERQQMLYELSEEVWSIQIE